MRLPSWQPVKVIQNGQNWGPISNKSVPVTACSNPTCSSISIGHIISTLLRTPCTYPPSISQYHITFSHRKTLQTTWSPRWIFFLSPVLWYKGEFGERKRGIGNIAYERTSHPSNIKNRSPVGLWLICFKKWFGFDESRVFGTCFGIG